MNVRGRIIAATLALGAFAAGPSSSGQAATTVESGDRSVALLDCSHGKKPSDRWALFNGLMSQMPGGLKMRMRFGLQQRVGRGAWRTMTAPGLGVWHESRPGIQQFAYLQRIVALQRGASYRVRVGFEWHDANGKQLAHEREFSGTCRQPGKLPNLTVKGVAGARPGPKSGTVRYSTTVVNSGSAVARRPVILLRVDGAEVDKRLTGPLRARERRTIHFLGPACRGLVQVIADPDDKLLEISEHDNELGHSCPPLR
jgi:CARDB